MNRIFIRLFSMIFSVSLLSGTCVFPAAAEGEGMKTVKLYETKEAFANPMKGFRPSRYIQNTVFPQGEYVAVCKQYIKFTDLEEKAEDTAEKIIAWSNESWKDIEKRNLKVIPRVVIVYPQGPDGGSAGYWPEGIDHTDPVGKWLSDTLKQRLVAFAKKLGEAWDNDPRVAAVEMGLWGRWGEHHISPLKLPDGRDRIPEDFQKALGDAFLEAFPHKKIMVRYPETFTDYDVGFLWDSFALPDDVSGGVGIMLRKAWKTQMISGETAYDWGNQSKLGGSPNGTLRSDGNTDYVIDWVKRMHASSLGWIAEYSQGDPTVAPNAARMQKALGYRYVINQASYESTVEPGGTLNLAFEVANVGSAPFYYPWPVEVSLLDKERRPVWTGYVHVDIRNWHPGCTYTVKDSFKLPGDLLKGTYILALAVLDPSGLKPSLRFANTNYYTGGRTPLGTLGVGMAPETEVTGPFDSLYADHTLYYTLSGDSAPVLTDTQVYPPEAEEVVEEPVYGVKLPGNLAFEKPVYASSTETQYTNYAKKAVDGDTVTRWSSEWNKDPSWISVDLEDTYEVSRVKLTWESSYAREYKLQVSLDNKTWTDVYETGKGRGKTEEITFDPVKARFVRIYMTKRALTWGYSLYEVEVYH
jgi:hypothetical protein